MRSMLLRAQHLKKKKKANRDPDFNLVMICDFIFTSKLELILLSNLRFMLV
jgi:hypothetical protein